MDCLLNATIQGKYAVFRDPDGIGQMLNTG